MSASCEAIIEHLASLNPTGKLGGEEGVLHGSVESKVSGILVTWMPTVAAIEHAVSERCDLIVSHEALTFHDYFPYASAPDPWTADRARLSRLQEHDITVLRAHSTIDPIYIVPQFVRAVGLSPAVESGTVWSFHREEPVRLSDLACRVAEGLGMECLRVTGNPERKVTQVGTMVGGLGLDRHILSWEKHLMGFDIDAIIAGETNDFAQRFALDSGIALIETCHSASEEPGLAVFADDLQSRFADTEVAFHHEAIPWTTV